GASVSLDGGVLDDGVVGVSSLGVPVSVDPGSPGVLGSEAPGSPVPAGLVGVSVPLGTLPRSGTSGAGPVWLGLPDSAAFCSPPNPALVKVSTPMSRLNSWPVIAEFNPVAATWADRSAASSVPVPVTALVTNLLTGLVAASPSSFNGPPRPPPTRPPIAPPKVANPRSYQPKSSIDRSSLAT